MSLEQEFNVDMSNQDAEKIQSVKDAARDGSQLTFRPFLVNPWLLTLMSIGVQDLLLFGSMQPPPAIFVSPLMKLGVFELRGKVIYSQASVFSHVGVPRFHRLQGIKNPMVFNRGIGNP